MTLHPNFIFSPVRGVKSPEVTKIIEICTSVAIPPTHPMIIIFGTE